MDSPVNRMWPNRYQILVNWILVYINLYRFSQQDMTHLGTVQKVQRFLEMENHDDFIFKFCIILCQKMHTFL